MKDKKDWSWVRQHMPRVAEEIDQLRALGLGSYVDQCWAHGVLKGEPGWFYAREGPIALGTPFEPREPDSITGKLERSLYFKSGFVLQLPPAPTYANPTVEAVRAG